VKETEMQRDPDLTAALERLAAADPLPPISPTALLARGQRGRRRRRVLSIGGVAAGVAAVIIAAALVPAAINTGNPEIAQMPTPVPTPEPTPASSLFTPIPGVPHGEAALAPVTRTEMLRRCKMRYGAQGRGRSGTNRCSESAPQLLRRVLA